jgi:hypothetical protein
VISVLDSDTLKDLFVVLHEFYRPLRTSRDLRQWGTEKYADEFAKEFIAAYQLRTNPGMNDAKQPQSS